MVNFFQNLFRWFVDNKDEIVLFFTSANFVTFVSTIILLIKQLKATKKNKEASDNLRTSIDGIKNIDSKMNLLESKLDEGIQKFDRGYSTLKQIEARSSEIEDSCLQKIDAILDVQSIVYSTLKDDDMRKNVLNILSTAKLRDVSAMADLQKQIEELKQVAANKVDGVVKLVEDETAKITEKVKTTSKKRATQRY